MEPIFKIADISDTEILVELIREFCEVDGHRFDECARRKALEKSLNDDTLVRVWLIQHGGEAKGYIFLALSYSLEYGGRYALIDELYIRESDRRQGIGKKSIEYIEKFCRTLEIQTVHLEVKQKNIAAQSFYRQMGFKDQERYLMTKWMD